MSIIDVLRGIIYGVQQIHRHIVNGLNAPSEKYYFVGKFFISLYSEFQFGFYTNRDIHESFYSVIDV